MRPIKKLVKGLIFLPRILTAKSRVLPDVLIVGAQKAGTTALYNHLVKHPDIFPSYRKEVHYFDHNYQKGTNWYRAFFPKSSEKQAHEKLGKVFRTIDASPYYMVHPHVAKRAKELLPNAKVIFILRDPIDRAISHYNHEIRKGTESLPIEDAFHKEPERINGEHEKMMKDENYASPAFNQFSYIKRGKYIEQLKNWEQYFGKDQIKVSIYDDFVENPQKVMDEVFEFIGAAPQTIEGLGERHNKHSHKVKLDDGLKTYLSEQFRQSNQELFDHIGKQYNWK